MSWLSGYFYRKSVTLSRPTGAVTNYQMKLLVGESSGATGEEVDCGGNCLSTFNDLRFTTHDGETLLDYWIESISGATPNQLATVWIEFDSIGTSDTTFYMYYGKTGDSAYSSISDTFLIGDDFERGSNGDAVGGDWVSYPTEIPIISTEQKYKGTRSAKLPASGATSYTFISKTLQTGDNEYSVLIPFFKEDNSNRFAFVHGNGSKTILFYINKADGIYYSDGTGKYTGYNSVPDNWHLLEINNINFTAGTYDIYYNETKIKSAAGMYVSSDYQNIIRIENALSTSGDDNYIDNIIVRNWRSVEPTFGSWGAEETSTVEISPLIWTIKETETKQYSVYLAGSSSSDVTSSSTFASSDEGIATISATGLATGVAEGTTTITATYFGDSATATLYVRETYSTTTQPKLLLRWRDDGYPIWSDFIEIDLDPSYGGDFIAQLNRMGSYEARQYEFRMSDGVDMALINAVENVN